MSNTSELEIAVAPTAGFAAAGSTNLEKAKGAFDSLAQAIEEAILPLRQKLALSKNAPDELELRLDLEFKGEAKWVVISVGGGAADAARKVIQFAARKLIHLARPISTACGRTWAR